MGTPYQTIYDAFLAKVQEDDWSDESNFDDMLLDWRMILEGAIVSFKYPRVSLKRNDNGFEADLGNDEIQILANLMKEEWLSQAINTWDNVKVMYDERDFSQGNLLDKLRKLLENTQAKNRKLQKAYSRSITNTEDGTKKPFDYKKFAGGEYL